jgi:PKD repeat protein
MFLDSIAQKGIRFHVVGLLLAAALSFIASAGHSQTVSANFDNRNTSSPVIPSGLFSIGGSGTSVTDLGAISTLTAAGLNETRFWIPLQQIYPHAKHKSKADFDYLDWNLERIQAAGLHPLGVIIGTPPSLGSNTCAPPSIVWEWGQMAASVVAHVDKKFPGLLQDYEIWNEPELSTSLCITDPTTRLNTYLSMFEAAASRMHAQAEADGTTIRTGGPVICQAKLAPTWIPALLNNTSTAPFVDFVSFHLYITGLQNIQQKMNWSQLYAFTQSSPGLAYYYKMIESLVRSGHQPNAASTPIYITEFNTGWEFAVDCCRNDPTYAPLWNSAAITDFLNVVYSGAFSVPNQLSYFNASGKYFCILGKWNSDMDCDPSETEPYPQFYAFKLFASPDYLDLQAGGHMASSVSPANTTTGLNATAFYTSAADNVVIINPTSSSHSDVKIALTNPGFPSTPTGTLFLLNRENLRISTQSVSLTPISGGYSATLEVPAYSTVALSVKPSHAGAAPTAAITLTQKSGTRIVDVDTSKSTGGEGAIVGRTIEFGDGSWLSWWPSAPHAYTKAGNYKIRVTVKNQSGLLSTATSSITLH